MSEKTDYKILLVDDEPDILEFVGYNLRKEGFHVETANNGSQALQKAQSFSPHLIILDVMMPGMDGIETCEEIRKLSSFKETLVVFLTARGEDYSQIAGFDAGADDYITKPVKPKVLISRIKALLKRHKYGSYRAPDGEETRISVGDVVIDREKYVVFRGDQELVLPKKEFELLLLLASKPDRVFSRNEIYSSVWGDNIIVGDRTIDVHIRKLREKIGQDHIKTIKGVGYKFVD
ncbi:response regulator transcription factor [Thermophagus sp. OGC60D27]|uniref:response regulator transcription factor n=1 Tax=Thermophagus sp. OGC60D27 TaxID=3458415 RepID=UPI004037A89B